MSNPTRYDLRVTDDGAGLYATDEPNTNGMQYVMANSYEALLAERDRLKEALAAMLEIHGVTQRFADTHIEIPQSWVDVSDFARAALQGEQP